MRCLLLIGLAGLAVPCVAGAQDIYMGTLEARDGVLILKRCDLGSTEYRLIDDASAEGRPVAALLKAPIAKPTSASVFGTYEEGGADRHLLKVLDIQDVAPGKSCHLMDAVDEMQANAGKAAE